MASLIGRVLLVLTVSVLSTVLSYSDDSNQTKCCEVCNATQGLQKYYSIVTEPQSTCGESCISPDQYWLYKIFEKNLEKAQNNTPCASHNFTVYWETQVHGEKLGIPVGVDFYLPYGTNVTTDVKD